MKLIELHILQSFPVSCLNRDDLGSPKSAVFGGVQRARISSQCLKRAIRNEWKQSDSEIVTKLFQGTRTKKMAKMIADYLVQKKTISEDRALLMGCAVAGVFNKKEGKALDPQEPTMETLFFASPSQIEKLAEKAFLEWGASENMTANKDKFRKECKEIGCHDAADIALFGRMVAAEPDLTLEGAAMFSHALSTHKTTNEIDFFSAIDDEKMMCEDAGAGMIGSLEFNASVYYRYAAVNLDLLVDKDHLAALTKEQRQEVMGAFIKATLLAIPSARKNSMNAHNPPAFVLGIYKDKGQPVQLINAFEEPIKPTRGGGYLNGAIEKLKNHHESLKKTWDIETALEVAIPEVGIKDFCERLVSHVN